MDEQLYAIAEEYDGKYPAFTRGKPYPVREIDYEQPPSFEIIDDDGKERLCLFSRCALINGDWIILKESELTPEQRRMAGLPTEDATIAELRERIEALEARVPVEEKGEPEWPQEGDYYWYIDTTGEVIGDHWDSCDEDIDRLSFLGVYPNRQKAKKVAKQVREFIDELHSKNALMP